MEPISAVQCVIPISRTVQCNMRCGRSTSVMIAHHAPSGIPFLYDGNGAIVAISFWAKHNR